MTIDISSKMKKKKKRLPLLDRIDTSRITEFIKGLLDQGLKGAGPLCGSDELARQYRDDPSYGSTDERVNALIRWEATKNFGTGFVSGLGGLLTLPVSIPASLYASWVVQARLVGAIAALYGHSTESDRVRTTVLVAVIGDAGKEILKDGGVSVANRVTLGAISKISEKALADVNKKIGLHLLTKAGGNGIVNLTRIVPVAGGIVGGIIDSVACVLVGKTAKRMFGPAGGSREALSYDLRFSGEKLSRIVRENVKAVKSVELPEDDVIAIRFRNVPVRVRYRVTGFTGGVITLRPEGNALSRKLVGGATRRRIGRMSGPAASTLSYDNGSVSVDVRDLIARQTGVKGLHIDKLTIRKDELGITFR